MATTLHHFVEISRYEMQMCDGNKSYRQVLLVMMCQLQGIEPTIVLNFFQSFNKLSLIEAILIPASLISSLVKRKPLLLHLFIF